MTDRKIIEQLADKELAEANRDYPLFHSPHEAFAVLREEVDELKEALEVIESHMARMWDMIRQDDSISHEKEQIHYWAIEATREAIQVAAMCAKITQSDLR